MSGSVSHETSHPVRTHPFWVIVLSTCLLIVSLLLCVFLMNVKPNKVVEKKKGGQIRFSQPILR